MLKFIPLLYILNIISSKSPNKSFKNISNPSFRKLQDINYGNIFLYKYYFVLNYKTISITFQKSELSKKFINLFPLDIPFNRLESNCLYSQYSIIGGVSTSEITVNKGDLRISENQIQIFLSSYTETRFPIGVKIGTITFLDNSFISSLQLNDNYARFNIQCESSLRGNHMRVGYLFHNSLSNFIEFQSSYGEYNQIPNLFYNNHLLTGDNCFLYSNKLQIFCILKKEMLILLQTKSFTVYEQIHGCDDYINIGDYIQFDDISNYVHLPVTYNTTNQLIINLEKYGDDIYYPNYNDNSNYNDNTNYNDNSNYNDNTNYNNNTYYNDNTNYNDNTYYNDNTNYNDNTYYNGNTNYNDNTYYNGNRNYNDETKYYYDNLGRNRVRDEDKKGNKLSTIEILAIIVSIIAALLILIAICYHR